MSVINVCCVLWCWYSVDLVAFFVSDICDVDSGFFYDFYLISYYLHMTPCLKMVTIFKKVKCSIMTAFF